MAYASGRNAYGISDRSGRRYRLREMKTEWTGAKVGPDEFEPKHPQLFPPREVGTVTVTISDTGNETVNATGSAGTSGIGSVTVNTTSANVNVSVTGLAATGTVGSISNVISDTFTVTVANPGSGNRYYIDGVLQATLTLSEGQTYVFNWSAATSHPLRFSTTSDGTHGGGSEYTTGVVKDDSAYTTQITVAASAPTLYYYCQYHSGMGGQINTP